MPIIPLLETEELIQELDKLRLDASKSFVSGVSAVSEIRIKPYKSGSYVSVYNAGDSSRWYLDYLYEFKIDIDATNNKLNFKEGATNFTATLASGLYTLAALATEIQTKMIAAGDLTYTVSVSDENEITIAAPTAFSLLVTSGADAATSIFEEIGFTGADLTGAITYTGDKIERVNVDITVELTSGTGMSAVVVTSTKRIEVISELADRLFSTDGLLKSHEFEISRYVPTGKSSFKYVHREAQRMILAWLDKEGYVDTERNKFTKDAIIDLTEVKDWSAFMTLKLIFESISNQTDDIFHEKAKRYKDMEDEFRRRAVLRLDIDGDGDADLGEQADIRTIFVARR